MEAPTTMRMAKAGSALGHPDETNQSPTGINGEPVKENTSTKAQSEKEK